MKEAEKIIVGNYYLVVWDQGKQKDLLTRDISLLMGKFCIQQTQLG